MISGLRERERERERVYRELERLETAGRCEFRDLLQRGKKCSIEGLEAFRSERHGG